VTYKSRGERWRKKVQTHSSGGALYCAYPFEEVGIRFWEGRLDKCVKGIRRSFGEPSYRHLRFQVKKTSGKSIRGMKSSTQRPLTIKVINSLLSLARRGQHAAIRDYERQKPFRHTASSVTPRSRDGHLWSGAHGERGRDLFHVLFCLAWSSQNQQTNATRLVGQHHVCVRHGP
jgi:hypothetical protein